MNWLSKLGLIAPILCFTLTACAEETNGTDYETTFDQKAWKKGWDIRDNIFSKFLSREDEQLKVTIPKRSHYGASIRYDLKQTFAEEPESLYLRYYLKLGADWSPRKGGKFPGLSGTYGRGGWGGRKTDGKNGWSVRGLFHGHKAEGTPFGFYVYHLDMADKYGSEWIWQTNQKVLQLKKERWYCIEYRVQMNHPQKADGILQGWVDGELAFSNKTMRFRSDPNLKIESIWLNVYMGGKWTDDTDNTVFIDDLKVSTEYIGASESKKYTPTDSSEPTK